ncbi:hypothetical protein ABC502_14625 [Alkalimonas sp. NCh-2]|uniref:hypothetical protein n=1 Tax=Alkalimonas sp. NCh-2 TaxID=3144846 RepID=UPI0031F6D3F7
MKYLLCALILIGAFFSLPSVASDDPFCLPGSTYNPDSGLCEIAAGYGTKYEARATVGGFLVKATKSTRIEAAEALIPLGAARLIDANPPRDEQGFHCNSSITFSVTGGSATEHLLSLPFQRLTTRTSTGNSNVTCDNTTQTGVDTYPITILELPPEYYCPPDDAPSGGLFVIYNPDNKTCGMRPERPDCDCSNLQGRHAGSFDGSLVDTEGQYSHENPPPCINVSDANGNQCSCGVVSNMWHATPIGATSTLRWTPFGGTFTGGSCGDDDTGPGERETCFTLANGTQWCLGDPNMDCQEINGMQQCRPGCGYFNDDFVCYDIDDPGTPDPDDTQQNPIDDNISDPNKPIQDMIKGDFKDVQRGTEQRLDNINITLGNQNNRLDGTNNRLDQANSKLDGIGRQLDGMGKELKGIGDTLGDAFGDDGGGSGDVDGNCTDDGICSWYESAYPDGLVGIWQDHSAALEQTAMFNFLNQFQIDPSGSAPDMSVCFNLGPLGDYGCHSLELHPALWGFLFICIQITAAFTCRRLIFGG